MPFTKLVLQREKKTLFCIHKELKYLQRKKMYFYKAVNLKCKKKKLIKLGVCFAPVPDFRGFLLG